MGLQEDISCKSMDYMILPMIEGYNDQAQPRGVNGVGWSVGLDG